MRRRPGLAEPVDDADRGPHADPESVARTIILTKLTDRARSRQELADALAAKAVPEDVSTRMLDRFQELGLVDDTAYAESWVHSRQQTRGLSRRALAAELRRKGVDRDSIEAAVSQVDDQDEREAAEQLVQRKLRSMRGLDPTVQARRLLGMLARKGYGYGLAGDVVRAAVAAPDEATD